MVLANHETVWKSKNRLWEIILKRNELYIINNKKNSHYTVEIDKNNKACLWSTSIITRGEVPAYVISRVERVYQELHKAGEII